MREPLTNRPRSELPRREQGARISADTLRPGATSSSDFRVAVAGLIPRWAFPTPIPKTPGPAGAGPGSTTCGLPLPHAAARSDADSHRLHDRQPRIAAGVPPRHESAGAGVAGYFDSDDHD